MRSILDLEKDKRGQLDPGVTTWLVLVVVILILGPVLLKIVRGVLVPASEQFKASNSSAMQEGGQQIENISQTFSNFWDGVLLFGFLGATVLLFISAFLVDAHPIFLGFYIFLLFGVILFAPNILEAVNNIYDANEYAGEVTYLSSMDFIRSNFGFIITAIGLLSALVMFAKMRYFS